MPQVTGIVKVYVNGVLHRSKEGASLDLGGYEREMVVGHSVYGHKDKLMQSTCEFVLAHMADVKMTEFGAIVDGTLKFECDSGVTYLVTNACVTKTLKVKGGDGEVEVEMQGDPAEEEE